MTTPLALAQTRHAIAAEDLAAAESELLEAMRAIEPAAKLTIVMMRDRRWESRLEGIRPYAELSTAWSAYVRAHRRERKAWSALRRAEINMRPPPAPRVEEYGLTAAEVLAGIRELRGERAAA